MKAKKLFRYSPMHKWTVALALRRTTARVKDAKEALMDIASIWGDVDQYTLDEVDRIAADVDGMLADLLTMIKERQAAGEEVGP